VTCQRCGNPLQPGDQFCGSCGAVNLPPAPQAEKVVSEPPLRAQGTTTAPRRRNRLWVSVAAVSVLLLVMGSVAALALNSGLNPLGSSDPRPAGDQGNAPAPKEPESSGTTESSTPETTTPSSTQPNPDEEVLEAFGRDYDEANRGEDWEETYSMLDEESQQQFTEEEWVEKQQALREVNGPLSPLQSVSVDLPEGVSDTSGNVILYYQDGTSDTIVAGIPMAVTSEEEEEAGEPKRTLTEEEISYLEQISTGEDTDETTVPGTGDLAAEAEQAAGDYYRAVGVGDFDYTYDNLDSETQAMFTREEWLQKNQWFAGNGSVIYDIESVYQAGTNDEYFAVTLKLTYEDGSSSTRTTYFVYENGRWLHRFGQEEKDLYGPGIPFEEWVEDQ
jgi:hypothetical protein